VVISERGLKEGTLEVKWRTDAAAHQVSAATAGEAILAELESTRRGLETVATERRLSRSAAKGR
jgi:prolyl-tRNA synthetase